MDSQPRVKCMGVVGAGQMGRGIAQISAAAGLQVRLLDLNEAALEKSMKALGRDVSRLVQKGLLEASASEQLLGRVLPTTQVSDLADCDFVIEAATEDQTLKQRIFADLDKHVKPEAILASNTSSISLTKLAGVTGRPERVIGMHFMNPVPRMKLVEIVRALQTNNETYEVTRALSDKLGKTSITTKDMPGFIVNRMLIPFINEACFALQEGLGTVEDIDEAAKLGLSHPMGPLSLADLIGLDTCLSIGEVLLREFGEDKYRPPTILRNYVAAGWLGRKTGRGFYSYVQGEKQRRKVA